MLFLVAVLAGVLLSLPLQAASYHVSASMGDDSWPGTEAQPWKTLTKASSMTYRAGDRLLLRRGDIWSDQELVLRGSAKVPQQSWITVGAYGGDPARDARPHITHPSKDRTRDIINWQSVVDWAVAHPGTGFDYYRDRNYVRIAIKILGDGWRIKDIEISQAEVGISNGETIRSWRPVGIGYSIENCWLHDMKGLSWPKHPNYNTKGTCFGTDPLIFGALHINGENVTFKDCIIDKNFDPNFPGGDAIAGVYYNAVFENLYIDKMYGGGIHFSGNNVAVKNCTILNGEYGEPPIGGAWYGPCVFDLWHITDFLFENSEIGFVDDYGDFADEEAISIFGQNAGVRVRNSYFHDCRSAPFAFHYNGMTLGDETSMNKYVSIENNVTYNNGLEMVHSGRRSAFSGDLIMPNAPSEGWSGLTAITFKDNRIYKGFAENPDQALHSYRDSPPVWYDTFEEYPTYSFPLAPAAAYNEVYNYGAYTDWPPLPKVMPTEPGGTNVALTAELAVSSGEGRALRDGDYKTSWLPDSPYDVQYASFAWDSPQTVDRIRLYDRPEPYHCARWIRISFSDGSEHYVYGGMQDNGALREIVFDAPKTNVTFVKFSIARWEGQPGLSEIRIYQDSVPAPAPPPAPDGVVDFEAAAAGRLTGVFDSIDWRHGDWWVRANGGYQNSPCLHIDFPPLKFAEPPTYYLRASANRTFFLPEGKKLESIRILAPKGATVTLSQTGAGSRVIDDCDWTWKQYTLSWARPTSNMVRVSVSTAGVSHDRNGIYAIRFDDIRYGD